MIAHALAQLAEHWRGVVAVWIALAGIAWALVWGANDHEPL